MKVVLVVAEKPSVATAIAAALRDVPTDAAPTTSISRHTSVPGPTDDATELLLDTPEVGHGRRHGKLPLHEFEAPFRPAGLACASWRVTSVAGHVFGLDFTREYQSWEVDPAALFAAPVRKVESSRGTVRHLESAADGAHYLVLATDADREGENIAFEVLSIVQPRMARLPAGERAVFRARFSAVARADILAALAAAGAPNEAESQSVDARAEIDLKVGVAFSRFITRSFTGRYAGLDGNVLSYGPCQTPTLGFIVGRADEIAAHTPEPYWTVELEAEVAPGRRVAWEWSRGRVFDVEVGRLFEGLVKEGATTGSGGLLVTSVEESRVRRQPPPGLCTTEMLKSASKQLGLGPPQAMRCAERLYLDGWISYPRTESSAYPASLDLRATVSELASHPDWGAHAAALLADAAARGGAGAGAIAGGAGAAGGAGDLRGRGGGTDVGDHPPIVPIACAAPGDIGGDAERLYELICRHFLASLCRDAVWLATTAKGSCGGEVFTLKGRRMIDPGFTAVLGSPREDVIIPPITAGTVLPVASVSLRQAMTTPPGLMSEAELLDAMTAAGIGTDASMASHIAHVLARGYAEVGPGRTLRPTRLGTLLVHGLHRIDSDLVLPRVRAAIEAQCSLVATGAAPRAAVVAHALENFRAKFVYFVSALGAMDQLFGAAFEPAAAAGRPLCRCGRCGRFMRLITQRPQRLYCGHCEESYGLPQGCVVRLYKELKCPLDGFELLWVSFGNKDGAIGKSYPLCPMCYNHGEAAGAGAGSAAGAAAAAAPASTALTAAKVADASSAATGGAGSGSAIVPAATAAAPPVLIPELSCNRCPHPTCQHSLAQTGVCPCPNILPPLRGVIALESEASTAAASSPSSSAAIGAVPGSEGRGGRGGRGGHRGRGRGGHDSAGGRGGSSGRGGAAAGGATATGSSGGARSGKGAVDGAALSDDDDSSVLADGSRRCTGTLVLDRESRPNWKLCCNSPDCNTVVRFHGELHAVAVLPGDRCEHCASTRLAVDFHRDRSPLPGGETRLVGCVLCDERLNALTELRDGRARHIALARRGGRGRGRGGRGRGRGRRGPMSKHDLLMSFEDF